LRRILDAIFYVLRTGCPWRYLSSNFPPWQTVLIVCTQMTKADVLTSRRRRQDVGDLDRTVGDDDASDEPFDQLAALVEGSAGQPTPHAGTEVRERGRHLREGLLLVHLRLQVLLLPLQRDLVPLEGCAPLPVLVEGHHAGLIGIAHALEVVVAGPQAVLEMDASRWHLLGQPRPHLAALEGRCATLGVSEHRAQLSPDHLLQGSHWDVACGAAAPQRFGQMRPT
jgi:hypothetical protein